MRGGTALQALALVGAGIGTLALTAAPAAAQDYTSGAVSGSVTDTDNKSVAGAQVTLRSDAQNQTRTFVTSSNGSFSASGLAPGSYQITVNADGYQETTGSVTIAASQENRVSLTVVSVNAPKDIVITSLRVRQDFTKTTTGLSIDVPSLVANVPIARSVTALTLLAPGTLRGVSGFGDVPSVGGSSVAENAYYINGLNITNPDTYVGSARVPFDFYKTVDVQTGGYAAEFGRATGGVINATTKSGTNEPFMAIHGNFAPSFASSRNNRNIGNPLTPSSIGSLSRNDSSQLTIEAGGALIKDHVFLYGLLSDNRTITKNLYPSSGVFERTKNTDPFYGGKVDVYLTSTQHLEFTYFNTSAKTYIDDYTATRVAAASAPYTTATIANNSTGEINRVGGSNWVGRYTGSITNFFQISAAYGISKDNNDLVPSDISSFYVRDQRAATGGGSTVGRTISTSQAFSGNTIDETKRKFWRVDGDLRFDLLGRHHIRFGVDNEDLSEVKLTQLNGSLPVRYTYTNTGVQLLYERLGGNVSGRDRAYYLQDSWEPTTGLTVNLGIRDDEFQQSNLSGQNYINFKGNWGLRAGFSFVPNGDSPFKLTGSYGRYFIPPAMNLGFRGRDLYFAEYYNYPGVANIAGGVNTAGNLAASGAFTTNPTTGLPLLALGTPQTGRAGYGTTCPTQVNLTGLAGAPAYGGATCTVLGAGVQDPAFAKVVPGTKATYEDEFILAARYQLSPLFSVGLTGTYRKLNRVSEDTDFSVQIYDQLGCGNATPSGTASQCNFYGANSAYYIWNPGASSVTVRDFSDATKTITLTGLTFPKPKRTYKAITFDWKRVDDGVWSFSGSITWSRLKGNTEGTVKSDAGNGAQTDAGSTQDFDYAGLADYSDGVLPNNRDWSFKAFGAVHVTKNLLFGANVQVTSPMYLSCEGFHPTDPYAAGYGASSFYCSAGAPNATGVYTGTSPSPRGTGLKSDWMKTLDLSLRYTVPTSVGLGKNFVLRVDAFNVFNTQSVLQRYVQQQTAELSGGLNGTYQSDPLYGTPTVYQAPRSIRFGFDIGF